MSAPGAFMAGEWRAGLGEPFQSRDPATGGVVWEGRAASAEQVVQAVAAARGGVADWARRPRAERLAIVQRYADRLETGRAALARLLSRETGKALWESEAEVAAMVAKVAISARAQEARAGEREDSAPFGRAVLRHKPHGVMAVFGPYNFPGHLPNGHVVPALLAGDTVVFKPSELAPAVGAAMLEAWAEAGAPPGVVNLVQGARATGAALLAEPVDGVLFTGSVETGLMIHRHFAGRPDVILALEMGGSNPLVVWDAADAEAAALIALHSAYVTTGQRCSCARRLILPEGAAGERVLAALVALLDRLRIGAWDDAEEPFMGPLVSALAADRVLAAQDELLGLGARALGKSARLARGPAFVSPGLLDATGLDLPDREVFGPLLTVWREPAFPAALARANATRFGLAAGLVSDRADLWERFRTEIRAGVVNWNRPTTGASSAMPFGGPGLSGNHRPSAYYAADYCAYPVASQEAAGPERLATRGLKPI